MIISSVMSPCPYKITSKTSATEAVQMMENFEIRHLPVVLDGMITGVLTVQQALLAKSFYSDNEDAPSVSDLPLSQPLVVSEDSDVAEVVKEMADKKLECALIANEEDMLVGIFTTTDVCRLVFMLLDQQESSK